MTLSPAEVLHWANERWREQRLSVMPGDFSRVVRKLATDVEREDGYRAANRFIGTAARTLTAAHRHAFDEDAIRSCAENYARLCARMRSLESRQSFALYLGIEPPAGKSVTPAGAAARLDDPVWWRRQLRKRWTRSAENAMRNLGVVRKGREPYASEQAVRHRRAQKRRMRDFLEGHAAVNELGEQIPLIQLAEHSTSNPAIRRGEFMTRVRGFEEIACDLGHVAEFVTLTAPSFFHAQLAAGGSNPLYQRAVVRDAQAWLCKMWARARAKLKRLSVLFYGFRIAEPHHDATPHWHVLLFARDADRDAIRMVLRGIWLSEFAEERGAHERRTHFETIDPTKGSAAGYVAKYVSKNIDGAGAIGGASDEETGAAVSDGIARVDAWASIHGIRQFQQLGGAPVGLWREARRLRSAVEDCDIERARSCADRGDWRGFTYAAGGISCGRRSSLRLEKAETGELNKYGECRPARVVGLRYASAIAFTRPHRWRIERKGIHQKEGRCDSGSAMLRGRPGAREASHASKKGASGSPSAFFSDLGPVAITVRGAAELNEPDGWSNPHETSQAGPEWQ